MAQGTIEAIDKAMPFLMQIADKPRSFIKTVEETTPIETAKKISHMETIGLSILVYRAVEMVLQIVGLAGLKSRLFAAISDH